MMPSHSNTASQPSSPRSFQAAFGDTKPWRGYHLHEHAGADRASAENFIRERFAACYGAQIGRLMPRLFSLTADDAQIIAGFGLREAAQEALFLERYLPQPIEACISGHLARPVRRDSIVEVGNFAGLGAGNTRMMIQALTQRLFSEGFQWVCFTGTTSLRNAFHRLALNPIELAHAEIHRLNQNERCLWGSYYDHDPRVLFGNVTEGYAALLNTDTTSGSHTDA